MGTSRETELKLALAASGADKVERLPWLLRLSGGRVERRKLRSVYFDTRTLELHEQGLMLRVRHVDRQRLQTIKTSGAGASFERGEWDHEISGDTPDLKLAKHTPLAPLAKKKKLQRKLRPIFETMVDRTTFPIRADGTEWEVAVDRGYIRTHGRRQRERISEIEIELKSGDPGELPKIATKLAHSVATSYAPRSKADRGYALICQSADAADPGREMDLDAHSAAGAAFRLIGLSCLDHATANERAIRHGDPEGIHQMRVGLRRLRAAISVFKEMLGGPETEALKRELKWLTEQLGRARDLDVLISKRVHPLRDTTSIGADAGVLERDLDSQLVYRNN